MLALNLNTLDVVVTPMTAQEVVAMVTEPIPASASAEPIVIANLNLHGLFLAATDPAFATFCRRADRLIIDGWPLWAFARLVAGLKLTSRHRVGSSDWLSYLFQIDPRMKVVAIGGTAESARRAAERVDEQCNRLRWYAFDGYETRPHCENSAAASSLDAVLEPGCLVLVGMGMPIQELWIENNRAQLSGCYVANVGGCIDYLSGEQPLAPRWIGALGLEWAYRLINNPRRLAHRYLIEPFELVAILLYSSISGRPLPSQQVPGETETPFQSTVDSAKSCDSSVALTEADEAARKQSVARVEELP